MFKIALTSYVLWIFLSAAMAYVVGFDNIVNVTIYSGIAVNAFICALCVVDTIFLNK